ncbi:MAG: hypothetical protein J5608_00560 [Alphaproteobacteria bacterium]|nr:hypothetical protein [Alphaproteobacteria bacterium]
MKNFYAFLTAFCVCLTAGQAMAALSVNKSSSVGSVSGAAVSSGGGTTSGGIKKAASVTAQEKSGLESITSGSLLPGVIGLVSGVSALTKQQKELEAECVPTGTEIEFVNDLVKEYAKIGEKTAKEMFGTEGECLAGYTYKQSVADNKPVKADTCYADAFHDTTDKPIWNGYPKAEVAEYCADGSLDMCSGSKRKKVSNIYEIFDQITFSEEDLTEAEASKYQKFKEKIEKCAPTKVASRKKEAYVGFVQNAISSAGQKTNTGTVWEAVGGMTQSGGLSGVQNLLPAVTQFLDK